MEEKWILAKEEDCGVGLGREKGEEIMVSLREGWMDSKIGRQTDRKTDRCRYVCMHTHVHIYLARANQHTKAGVCRAQEFKGQHRDILSQNNSTKYKARL